MLYFLNVHPWKRSRFLLVQGQGKVEEKKFLAELKVQ